MDEREQAITRYLLGELTEQEQAALEKSYFKDPNVFDQVLQVESRLVDAYARGQLSSGVRERFEQSYLKHPLLRERVEFARALTARIDEKEASVTRAEQSASSVSWWHRLLATVGGQRPRLRLSMALATVVIVLVAAWIFVTTKRRQQLEAAQTQVERQNQEQRAREQTAQQQPSNTALPIPQHSPSPSTSPTRPVAFLALTVGGVRGADNGGTQTLIIPHDTPQAQILLKLKDNSYPRYRVSLQKIGGAEILSQTNLKPRITKSGASFGLLVPADKFAGGDYVLTLKGVGPNGVDDISKSLFRVEKR